MDQATTPAPSALRHGTQGQPVRLSWTQPAGLMGLCFSNAFLRLVTLGIYNFWAKTAVRKRVWSAVRLNGEPLSYTGTGKELLLGFLIIFAAVVLPIMLLSVAVAFTFEPESTAAGIFQLLIYAVIFVLTGIAMYRAQRYRLSRTTWRGIRGALVGSDRSYAWAYCWTACLIPVTLGWIMPWRTTMLQGLLIRDTRFGDRPFRFTAQPGPLYPSFTVFWIGCALIMILAFVSVASAIGLAVGNEEFIQSQIDPNSADPAEIAKLVGIIYGVLGVAFLLYYILSAWYRARQINHFASHTFFEGAKFTSTVSGLGLVRVAIGNFALTMLGWGIGFGLFLGVVGAASAMAGGDTQSIMVRVSIFAGIVLMVAFSGLFSPFVQARNARYLIENTSIEGVVPLAEIAQAEDQGIRRGEGLAQAFDVDAF